MRYIMLLFLVGSMYGASFSITPGSVGKIKKICKAAKGGDTIYLRSGEYTDRFPKITCKGDGAYIHITSYPNEIATIRTSWNVEGSYLKITNLHFRGYNDSITYDEVIKQWWKPKKYIKARGLTIEGDHIVLKDNAVGLFPSSGIKFKGDSDYLTIEHNIIYNNAWWSTGGTGGLIVKNIHQIDNAKATKVKIVNNLLFSNESRIYSHVFKKGFSKLVIDEGESFLIQQKDDARKKGAVFGHYEGRYLVEDNVILFNGKGTSLNKANGIDFVNNTLYCNGTTANSINAGGVRANHSNSDTFVNNAVESCRDRKAFSVKGENNIFKNNYAKSTTQEPHKGIVLVKMLFKDPEHLNFYTPYFKNRANQTVASFDAMLGKFDIKIKPTNYTVEYQKQRADIITAIPKTADTKITKLKDKVIIKNIDNKGIKGLDRDFELLLPNI